MENIKIYNINDKEMKKLKLRMFEYGYFFGLFIGIGLYKLIGAIL